MERVPVLCIVAVACLAASAPAQLTVTNGLQVWLRADVGVAADSGGKVLNWTDQSGNGNNASYYAEYGTNCSATYVERGLNGLPVLSFNGLHYYGDTLVLAKPLNLSKGASIFIVARNADVSNTNKVGGMGWNGLFHLGNTANPFTLAKAGIDDLDIYWGTGDSSYSGQPFYAVNAASSYLLVPNAGPTAALGHGYLYDVIATAGGATQRVDQVDLVAAPPSGATVGSHFLPTNTASYAAIGIGYAFFSYGLDGDIAEILVYNAALSLADRDAVERYLHNKWFVAPKPIEKATDAK